MKKTIIVLGIIFLIMLFGILIINYLYNSSYGQNEIKSYDCCDVPLDEKGYPKFSVFAPCLCNNLNIFEKTLIVLGIRDINNL